MKSIYITIFATICVATSLSAPVYADEDPSIQPICEKVQHLLDTRTIKEVVIARVSSKKVIYDIDIDNNGTFEKITFFPTRTYGALSDVTDNKRITIPIGGEPSVSYAEGKVIKLDDKNYVLHSYHNGDSHLTELFPRKDNAYNYDYKLLCHFEKSL